MRIKYCLYTLLGFAVLLGVGFLISFPKKALRADEPFARESDSEKLENRTNLKRQVEVSMGALRSFEIMDKSDPKAKSELLAGLQTMPANEQQSLSDAFSKALYKIRDVEDHQKERYSYDGALLMASNRAEKLRLRFLEDRLRLLSEKSHGLWEVELGHKAAEDFDVLVKHAGARMEYDHGYITEWFDNGDEGIEHGYVVWEKVDRVRGPEGELEISVEVDGLDVRYADSASGDLVFSKNDQPVLAYQDLKVWDADGNSLVASLNPTTDGFQILVADTSAQYPISIDPMITSFEAKMIPPEVMDGVAGNDAEFGDAVSLDGDTALIGAEGSGSAYVFVKTATGWEEEARLTLPSEPYYYFGCSVSLDGDTALIGELITDTAHVFVRSGTTWTYQAELEPDLAYYYGGYFGSSVSLKGDTAVVGAPEDDTQAYGGGAVYVFRQSGTTWSQEAVLLASDGDYRDEFGDAVSLDGGRVLIGAPGVDSAGYDAGAAYVFERSGSVWTELAKIEASDASSFDDFGKAVSLSGTVAAIGARGYFGYDAMSGDFFDGACYVFRDSGSGWLEEARLGQDQSTPSYHYEDGSSVSLDGNRLLVGGGSIVFVYDFTGGAWVLSESIDENAESLSLDGDRALIGDAYTSVYDFSGGVWTEIDNFTIEHWAENDEFGNAVAISGDTILVGVENDDDNGEDSGAAYVFVRSGTSWSEEAKLLPSSANSIDLIGRSIVLEGDTAILGGQYGSAAYVFSRSGTSWTEEAELKTTTTGHSNYFGRSIALQGNKVLVGSSLSEDGNQGSLHVFKRAGSTWNLEAKLMASDGHAYDAFGESCDYSGTMAVVGASRSDTYFSYGGGVYVFENSGSIWTETDQIISQATDSYDHFGDVLSLDGTTLMVGKRYSNDGVFVFEKSANGWVEQAKIPAAGSYSSFGSAIHLNGDMALVGASYSSISGNSGTGKVHIYKKNGIHWVLKDSIQAPDGSGYDYFGASLAMDGDTLVVGADRDTEDLYRGEDHGSVYVFRISEPADTDGDAWSDGFEMVNGFNASDPTDVTTQDSDGDGILDVFEIYQGSDPNDSSSGEPVCITPGSSGSSYTLRSGLSSTATGILAIPEWSMDLENWYGSGATVNGASVTINQTSTTLPSGLQVTDWQASNTAGDPELLFLRLGFYEE